MYSLQVTLARDGRRRSGEETKLQTKQVELSLRHLDAARDLRHFGQRG